MIRHARLRPVAALLGILWMLFVATAMPARGVPGWACVALEAGGEGAVACCGTSCAPVVQLDDCCGAPDEQAPTTRVICCELEQGPAVPSAPAPRVTTHAPTGDLALPRVAQVPNHAPPGESLAPLHSDAPSFLDTVSWTPFVGRAPPSFA